MKLFLSGLETFSYLKDSKIEIPLFILGSFFYLKKSKLDFLNKYIEFKNKCNDFILDSGAFSLLNSSKNLDTFLNNLDRYIQEYINFINKYDIKHFIELDIDSLVGYERVKEIRKRIEKETNKKCIPAWHLSRGLEEWKNLTKEYDYVAIGGIVTKEIKKRDYKKILPQLLKIARQNNCKVHGLGFTGNNLKEYDFYSVDSSSWSWIRRHKKLSIFNYKTKSIDYRYISETHKIKKDKKTEVELCNITIREWKKFQAYLLGGEQ